MKVDNTNGRPARASEKNGRRMLLGENSLYAEVLKSGRVIFFHDVQHVEITSSRGKVKVKELKEDTSWKTISLRPNEVITFAVPEHIARYARNQVKSIIAS